MPTISEQTAYFILFSEVIKIQEKKNPNSQAKIQSSLKLSTTSWKLYIVITNQGQSATANKNKNQYQSAFTEPIIKQRKE